jgi:hypothetical protein
MSGGEWMPEVLQQVWDEFNERNGTDFEPPRK